MIKVILSNKPYSRTWKRVILILKYWNLINVVIASPLLNRRKFCSNIWQQVIFFAEKKMFLSEYQNFLCSFNVSTADLLNIFLMILSIIKKLSMIKSTLLYLVKMKPKTSSCLLVVRLYDSKLGRQFAYLPKCKMFLLILHM